MRMAVWLAAPIEQVIHQRKNFFSILLHQAFTHKVVHAKSRLAILAQNRKISSSWEQTESQRTCQLRCEIKLCDMNSRLCGSPVSNFCTEAGKPFSQMPHQIPRSVRHVRNQYHLRLKPRNEKNLPNRPKCPILYLVLRTNTIVNLSNAKYTIQ